MTPRLTAVLFLPGLQAVPHGRAEVLAALGRGGAVAAAADIKAGRPVILGYGKRRVSARGLGGGGGDGAPTGRRA